MQYSGGWFVGVEKAQECGSGNDGVNPDGPGGARCLRS